MVANESPVSPSSPVANNSQIAGHPRAKPPRRSLWPAGIITFFVVLAVFNAILFALAYYKRPAAVVENPYEDSLSYEDVIKKERFAEQLGLTVALQASSVRPDGNRDVVLAVHSTAPAESWKEVVLSGQRPSDAHLDTQKIALSRSSDNAATWQGSLPLAVSGMWMFTVTLRAADGKEALVKLREILP